MIFSIKNAGNLEIIKLLIENGAEVNGKDNLNRTAIHLAAKKGMSMELRGISFLFNSHFIQSVARLDIINILIENEATVKGNPFLLHFAVNGGIFKTFST